MDPSFFGLEGHPFGDSSDREDAYLAETHASLITELRAGLKAPHGITLLIGDEGTGKTTLIRSFADELADSCTVAYLPTTGPGLRHLLTEAIEQLGGSPPPAGDEQALLESLAALAKARAEHGRSTLVIVDDAHELPAKTIERVGRLFGDDPAEPSMLHVVLVGRPELLDRMNAANDRTILKHLVQVCRMDPIGPEESFRYIADRIAKVGGIVDKLFTEDALRLIVKRANGNPGRIDAICTAALEQAAESGEPAVAAGTVDLACMEGEGYSIDPSHGNGERDAMQYIFGEDEEEGQGRVQRRLHGTNGAKDAVKAAAASAPSSAATTTVTFASESRASSASRGGASATLSRVGELAAGLRERMGAGNGRQRLAIWAVGLVALLIGFSAMLTRTGDRAEATAEQVTDEPTKLAAAQVEHADDAKPAVEVPADAVRTSRLIVKRDGGDAAAAPAAAPTPTPAGSPAQIARNAPPTPQPTDADAARVRVQSPPHDAAAAAAPVAGSAATPTAGAAPAATAAAVPATAAATTAAAVASKPAPATAAVTPPAVVASKPAAAPAAPVRASSPPAAPAAPVVVAAARPPKPATTASAAKAGATSQVASTGSPPGPAKYTVQVGAFKSRSNAEALLAQVQKSYPDGRIVATGTGDAPVFRVISGAFVTKNDAASRARTLAENGHTTFVRDIPQ